ncbi:uncharacterized protein LOC135708452 [Ochlerotatus camptorhynchus]|uniref:uncharacterized protein LOC135708452 n=1 Tax=Ochlerotatus camptorhynchus TaxID=644619 RepID=UPI0031DCB880
MALKVLFLATCALTWLYWLQVPNVSSSFSSVTCHRFRRIERTVLYDFVTYSELVDKWMSIVSFVASDQRPMGIGKTYKIIIDSSIILHLNVTHHTPGRHIALESQSGFLRPHLELWFFAQNRQPAPICHKPPRPSASNDPMNIINTRSNSSGQNQSFPIEIAAAASTKLPPQTGVHNGDGGRHHHNDHHHGCWIGQQAHCREMKVMDVRCGEAVPANVISGDAEHHRRRRSHQLEDPQSENDRSSLLGVKFYFKHNSFLFQHTLGRLLRQMIGRQFRRSLRHLELILGDMETLQRNLYR